jgi:hypothetical protein
MSAVVHQLVNGLMHIGQRRVALLLLEGLVDGGIPPARQLLQRADIQTTVVHEVVQHGHVAHQKSPVLVNGVAAHGRGFFGHKPRDECQQFSLGLGLGQRAGLDLVDQSAAAVCAFVPGIHPVQHGIVLVNDQHRPLHARCQVGACDDQGNLQQAVFFRVQTAHFAIDPDQVHVVFQQARRVHRVWLVGVAGLGGALQTHAPFSLETPAPPDTRRTRSLVRLATCMFPPPSLP